jgi:hypothetical protein
MQSKNFLVLSSEFMNGMRLPTRKIRLSSPLQSKQTFTSYEEKSTTYFFGCGCIVFNAGFSF